MTESLYRKYRPQTFADVVGQDAIERTLRNALAQNKVSHAYLFCGPRGTGKTTTARLMAKAILCEKGVTPDPDGTCEACRMVAEGTHPDVYELDAASRTGVDNVREEIIGRVNFAPTQGRAKIYIIDEVHMLSTAAFNALLKTLEEPPDHVVFILCTTDPNKVPATIHSRCQRFDFHRISVDQIVARLGAVCVEEDVEFEPEALELIAERSEGGMRNALTALEQLMVFSEGKVTRSAAEDLLGTLDSSDMANIVGAIGRRDAAACFTWMADFVETGADLAQFARDLAEHIRALYILQLAGDDAPLEVTDLERAQLMRERPFFGTDRLARLLMIMGDLMNELRTSTNPRLSFEIALTRMVHPASDLTLESLAERIETLEKGMAAYRAPAPTAPAPTAAAPAPAVAAAASAPAAAPQRPAARPAPVFDEGRDEGGFADVPDDYLPAEAYEDAAPAAAPARPAARQPRPAVQPPARPYQAPAQRSAAPSAARPTTPPVAPVPAPAAPAAPAQPASAPVAAAAGDAGTLANPAALQRCWQATLAALKKEKAAYGVLFMNAQVKADPAANAVLVVFPATNKFAYMSVRKPEVSQALERAAAAAFGFPVSVRFVQEGSPEAQVPVSRQAPPAAPAAAPASRPARPVAPAPAPRPAAPAALAAPRTNDTAIGSGQFAPAPQAAAPRPAVPAQAPAVPTAPEAGDDQGPATEEDFASMLAAGFGAGITVEEVDGTDGQV